jgi:hypothetical protein
VCAVSVVLDYGRDIPFYEWNQQMWREFHVLKDQAEEFDRKTDQPDCEDSEKGKWMKEVEERLKALEEDK